MSEDKIKSEPKVLPQRLMSFRGSRDLSLGSVTSGKSSFTFPNNREKSRKHFTPNVNVQRKKNQDLKVKNEYVKANEGKHVRGSRGRGHGRGRQAATLVQASGSVFAEGIAVSARAVKSGSRYSTESVKNEFLQMPTLNLKQNNKINKAEDERKLKELLRDDFVDDTDLAPDAAFAPISLPLNKYIKKTENGPELNLALQPKIKEEKEIFVDGVKIKKEVVEKEQEDCESNTGTQEIPAEQCIKKEPQPSEIFDGMHIPSSQSNNERQLILIQFPDRLPALAMDTTSDEKPNPKNKLKTEQPPANQESVCEGSKYCQLSDLAAGHIGHLQIRRSGKIELVLGKCVLNVSPGTHVGFQQDLVAVQLHPGDQYTGDTVDLGPVTSRLICTPDWNTLLKCGGNR